MAVFSTAEENGWTWWNLTLRPPYQLLDFRLQVLYAVELPLAAALGGDPVLAPPPDVVDAVQLLWGQLVHPQQGLEVIPGEGDDALGVEGKFYLGRRQASAPRGVRAPVSLHLGTTARTSSPSRGLSSDLEN